VFQSLTGRLKTLFGVGSSPMQQFVSIPHR